MVVLAIINHCSTEVRGSGYIIKEFGLGSCSPYVRLSSLVSAKVCGCYSASFPCPTYSTKYIYILKLCYIDKFMMK